VRKEKVRCLYGGIVFLLFGMMAFGQSPSTNGGSAPPSGQSAGSPGAPGSSSQNPFFGSVPTGKPAAGALPLSFRDAIDRGLKYNLGLLLTGEGVRTGRGQRWKELSNLLPNVTADTSANVKQVDLATVGIRFPTVPTVVGPFGYFDTRAYLKQPVFDWKAVNNVRSANENLRASEYSYKNARELVVLAVGYAYLQAIAGEARVETTEAQRKTAQALYNQAADQQKAGVSPAIDTLRANVELQSRQQMLIAARNDFSKLKLTLARAIGLPLGQELELTDRAPYRSSVAPTVDEALTRAYARRSDYQSALAQVRASEYARRAATHLRPVRGEAAPLAGAWKK
jgi:outer membrane protein TolC